MNTKESSQSKLSSDMELPYLKPLERLSPVTFPKFPTLEELVQQETQVPVPRKLTGIFDGFLSDLTPLIEDFSQHPKRYGAETHDLLERLRSGSTSIERLSTTERLLLDRATYDFFQAPEAPRTAPLAQPSTEKVAARHYKPERPRIREPSTHTDELPEFWWL